MNYKVFLVEDEIATREGIREKVDWKSAGCEFCGEAPDGEMALPLIETCKPDILVTDIKMPFMDGLQLSRIVRNNTPSIKIIILSGYDEFEYAQAALKLGVTEYLLKPISSEVLTGALQRVTTLLDQEARERNSYKKLQEDAKENIAHQREKFLLRLVMGGVSSAEVIEQGQQLGLDMIAPYYMVLLLKIELCDEHVPFNYHIYQRVEQVISKLAGDIPDVLFTRKSLDEYVFILSGEDPDEMRQVGIYWTNSIKQEVGSADVCKMVVKMGSPQQRLGDIHHSFAEALVGIEHADENPQSLDPLKNADQVKLLKLEHPALENYLKFGDIQDYDEFFADYFQPINQSALHSDVVRNYLLVDILLTITQFFSDLGIDPENEPAEIKDVEKLLENGASIERTNEVLKSIITNAIKVRSGQAIHERLLLIQQAKAYIDQYFSDPDLKMSKVAEKFNFSSGYFSLLFSQNVGKTFRDYLNLLRINHAKELLRTTNLKCSEIASRCGYRDAHYFSTIFKNNIGFTPQQFRTQPQEKTG